MYDPNEAKKSYGTLFVENGTQALIKGSIFALSCYLIDKYILQQSTATITYSLIFFISTFYYTWKPKLIRFLRGLLRGEEYRDRAD